MKTRYLDLGGPVHLVEFGGEGRPIVLLHGLGASHTSWMPVGAALAKRGRVIAPDLIGFGRTNLEGREPTIEANVRMLGRLLDEEVHEPAIVIGNSMGGLVSIMLAPARPERVERLVLVAPALPHPFGAPFDPKVAMMFTTYMIPFVGENAVRHRLAQVGPEGMLRDLSRMCGVDPERMMPEAWARSLEIAHERAKLPWMADALVGAARSIVRTLMARSHMEATIRNLSTPALLTHGTKDRLVSIAASEAAAKLRWDWTMARMEGVGHTPQVEVPERWLGLVNDWLG